MFAQKKIYLKDESFDPIYREVSRGFYAKTRIFPSLLFFSGLFVFATQVLLPVAVFKTSNESIDLVDNTTLMGRAAGFYSFQFSELKLLGSKAFPTSGGETSVLGRTENEAVKSDEPEESNFPEYFYLSIPKLRIKEAQVRANSEDLNPSTSLGHYQGTALPGQAGNAFIYGHSVLPWFFNPKNYKTIFSTLGNLEPGDEFFITYNNQQFNYVVETTNEVHPSSVRPLDEIKPKYLNESTVVLMTCSPPGTKLKRLLVNGVLVD